MQFYVSSILPGVVVKCVLFDQRKRPKCYLAVVINTDKDLFHLKFLRQEQPTIFVFPSIEDVSWEPSCNVSLIQPQASYDHRQRFVFPPDWDFLSA
jgi:hypothetical protein